MIALKPACRQMSALLIVVTKDQLTSSTSCAKYSVADLIDHVDEVSRGFAAVARKDGDVQTATPANADHTTTRVDRWWYDVAEQVQALGEAWDDPAAWQGSTDAAGVELSNELWGKIALTEMVVHGWDLARSTGHPLDLPEETLRACLGHVVAFVPVAPVPELWGPAVEASADASLLDRIVAITGRAP